ncbi:MAG: sulfatase-like hydrolase/transferase, partial [Clostridiales bacterium]|nr:sulfatase-like hydrolase/transferase [Clostridiales bacterium]
MRYLRQTRKQLGNLSNTILYSLFPVLITMLLYQNPEKIAGNFEGNFKIAFSQLFMFFISVFLVGAIYSILSALLKKPWISAAILGISCYFLAMADIAKYQKLGTRITIDDLLMAPDMGKIWSFAKKGGGGIHFQIFYVVSAILLVSYIFLLFYYKVSYPCIYRIGRFGYVTVIFIVGITFSIKGIAKQVFLPQIMAYEDVSSYSQKEISVSSIDCLIGSMYSTTKPPNTKLPYNEENVSGILSNYRATETNAIRPDVIVVLSESYFDLNSVYNISLTEDIYKNFRRMQTVGTGGEIVVPAFGGGTAATEYEVLSGTPNKGISNSKAPYRELDKNSSIWTFQTYFKNLGYSSTFIHPFLGSFYNRKDAFTSFGFDNLIFQDNLTVPIENYPRDMHISDSTFFHQIKKTLNDHQTDAPQLIFATSMQNHSPYATLSDSDRNIIKPEKNCNISTDDLDAMNAYANGIADTDKALGEFLDYVDQRKRPTVVVFYGDHHPLLEGYEKLNGIESSKTYDNLDNISTPFAIYTNYTSKLNNPKCSADHKRISAFYLMDVLINYLDLPKTKFTSFLDDAMRHVPIVSMKITVGDKDESLRTSYEDKLLLLSYDRLLGQQYSCLLYTS